MARPRRKVSNHTPTMQAQTDEYMRRFLLSGKWQKRGRNVWTRRRW